MDCERKRKKRKEERSKKAAAAANKKAPFIMVAIIPNQSACLSIDTN